MYINQKKNLPNKQKGKDYSVRVLFYLKNHRRFGLCYYNFSENLWMDNDGVILTEDFIWTYLPIKQFRAFLKATEEQKDEKEFY